MTSSTQCFPALQICQHTFLLNLALTIFLITPISSVLKSILLLNQLNLILNLPLQPILNLSLLLLKLATHLRPHLLITKSPSIILHILSFPRKKYNILGDSGIQPTVLQPVKNPYQKTTMTVEFLRIHPNFKDILSSFCITPTRYLDIILDSHKTANSTIMLHTSQKTIWNNSPCGKLNAIASFNSNLTF